MDSHWDLLNEDLQRKIEYESRRQLLEENAVLKTRANNFWFDMMAYIEQNRYLEHNLQSFWVDLHRVLESHEHAGMSAVERVSRAREVLDKYRRLGTRAGWLKNQGGLV